MLRFALVVALFAAPSSSVRASDPAPADAKKVEFFETKIRPVLVEQCYKCHSETAEKDKKLKAGLKLDTKAALLAGGDTGAALVPGKPEAGTLLKSLKYDGDLQMPPKGKLPDAVIKDFEQWIADGAVDPRTGETAKVAGIDIEKGKQFWSFQAPKASPVPAGPAHPIDAFVAAKLAEKGLTPVARADKRTLIRRASYNLTGLPPAPEAVDAFLADEAPDAFEKVVDRLLASPQYGEKWGRHWLDVARYAEDQAHTFAVKPRNQAWRYRDWVVAAFNADMPYDRFVKLQIAGDMLPDAPSDPFVKFAGLGFLGLGAEYYKNTAAAQAIAEELDDRVDTVTRGFLGLTVACARCHDHKFDPIPTRDYYSLAGIYMGTDMSDAPLGAPAEVKAYQTAQASLKKAEDRAKKLQSELKAKKDPLVTQLAKLLAYKGATDDLAQIKKAMPAAPPVAHVISGNGAGMKVYVRGNPATKGEDAPKGFLQVLPSPVAAGGGYSRLDLANAIGSKDNPLTARVFVNRVWAWHFGRGLVGTPSNFGALGDKPSHPELLDWLAVNFVKNGWSVKWLHRQIMTAAAYQLESRSDAANDKVDAANVYLWRGARKRLEIEDWRDTLLAVSGNLDPQLGGPAFDLRDPAARRRTVYAKVSRHELDGLLRLFDFPDANVTADKRTVTTVPQQQLFALNSAFMVAQAQAFAKRVDAAASTDEERVAVAYRLAFGRAPEKSERDLALRFLALPLQAGDKLTRWQQYAQVLLASNELLYVD
ncbi:PSD1 and planctomycete cytochrome C domain-containing protein [Gemmata sp. JC673]|uniref:PSD1 and planctomycete cytochrome C domain-containing protein n=1 Tax=Gemmata algarum TaxID=2975278 RepID=A0ABU5F243_9BACT|nr:PSD1 and planctomycete cytochrome C domain-containing protein [Gemmata algarum]MDY3561259.1 PSD1 and planctomycete cytochrome C domain-containing protein [Gemmata algarum]